jgi:hypothetical protein
MIVWGNRFLGKQGNVSWSLDSRSESDPVGGSGLGAIDRADDNLSIDGRVSGTDHKGRSWSLGSVNGNPPDAGQRSAIAAKLAQLDAWVADIRSAGGYSNDNPAPNPPPPPPPSGPVAPTLLD